MKRTVTEVLRRGFENVLANWPLLAIRIAEGILIVTIAIMTLIAIVVPFVMSIASTSSSTMTPASNDPADIAAMLIGALSSQLLVIVYALIALTIALTLFIAIHSFVSAGCARVYADAEQQVVAVPAPSRDQMRVFSADRWMRGGRESWWPVFWIYNIAWSVAALIILIPLTVVMVAVLLLRETEVAALITGCVGILAVFLFVIPIAVVTGIWTEKAIVVSVVRRMGAMRALGDAWREFRGDAGRHIAIALVMFIVSFAASMVFGSLSTLASIGQPRHGVSLVILPMQMTVSILNSILSSIVGAWFLACFSSLSVEQKR